MDLKIYQKGLLKMAKKDQLQAIALMKRKQILKVFLKMVAMATSHSLWRFYLIALTVNNPYSFTKQGQIFKQAYLVGFCFVLLNELKISQLALVCSAFYRLYLEINLFCTKPSEQILCCHVTDVKMLRFFFSLLNNDTTGLW